jgi:pantoate--beta-alanine ligase
VRAEEVSDLQVVDNKAAMRELAERWRREGASVGLVPTLGALHEGHLSLARRARADCERVVVNIFLNPLQFNAPDDLAAYPRTMERDLQLAASEGADVAFTPSVEEIYTPGESTRVRVEGISDRLEGVHRPGHFDGVMTVIAKLFNIVRPRVAYFGQKDAQQAALITRMAREMDTGIRIAVLPTVREPDGLACSSRNLRLGAEERQAATCLYRALNTANQAFLAGERDLQRIRNSLCQLLESEPLARVEYAELVDPQSFEPPGTLAVLAVWVGEVRLIDNHRLGEPLT